MNFDNLIERVAIALANRRKSPVAWGDLDPAIRAEYLKDARVAVDACLGGGAS